jgi:predicted site-specific integrase-resolvase
MAGLMKIQDAAEWLGVSDRTLSEWVTARRVPFTTLASCDEGGRPSTRTVRFAQHHLDAIVAMGEQRPEVAA